MKLINRFLVVLIVLSASSCAFDDDPQPSTRDQEGGERDLLELIGAIED
ncbi:MAG: hypothetical protein R8N23_05685 [Reichenbachiella sp.]|nr:hypothetical protein [Reichenbachiella sp.]MDW3209336.1 hypothetical protein [Reichenbachiella sp.]